MNSKKILIKACVLTKNEEKDLTFCLSALSEQFERIIVLDSGSKDSTLNIAKKFNCEIIERIPKEKFIIGEQRNWILFNQRDKCEYVLFIDADEIIPNNFEKNAREIIIKDNLEIDCYQIGLIYNFHGKEIKSLGFPNWHDRLVKTTALLTNEVYEYIQSENKKKLNNFFVTHYWNSKGINKFIQKHLFYAEDSAQKIIKENKTNIVSYNAKTFNQRSKKFFKNFGLLKPFMRFIYHYFLRFGILEGREGFIVAIYMAIYEFFIEVNKIEIIRKEKGMRL